MSDRIIVTTVYLRTTQGGTSHITEHQTWDAGLMLQSRIDDQAALRDKGKPFAIIEVATQAEYRAFQWPKQKG